MQMIDRNAGLRLSSEPAMEVRLYNDLSSFPFFAFALVSFFFKR